MLNVPRRKEDEFYRYKMPDLIHKVEGKGNHFGHDRNHDRFCVREKGFLYERMGLGPDAYRRWNLERYLPY